MTNDPKQQADELAKDLLRIVKDSVEVGDPNHDWPCLHIEADDLVASLCVYITERDKKVLEHFGKVMGVKS